MITHVNEIPYGKNWEVLDYKKKWKPLQKKNMAIAIHQLLFKYPHAEVSGHRGDSICFLI